MKLIGCACGMFRELTSERCCVSCHDDADAGYYDGQMCTFDHNGQDYDVCCKIYNALKEIETKDIDGLIK